ncbi:MAG: hypothetical protein MPW14_14930 [Candidatus Manganitrophus sp.]|nr:MAG: hypothetical protein MPW14_14930 [Candidatus Manganitrophus sp.]
MIAALVSMSTRRAVVRLAGAFHDALDLPELAAHLDHHRAGRAADRFHRHGAEQVGDQAADEQADDHLRVGQVEDHRRPSLGNRAGVVGEQHQRGQAGRADRVALGHRLGGVADGVERVGDVAHLLRAGSAISAMPPALSVIGP